MESEIFPTELWKCKLNPVYSLITGDLLHNVCNQPRFKFVTACHGNHLKLQIMQTDLHGTLWSISALYRVIHTEPYCFIIF
jgi:hypothetical protein